MTNDEIVSKHKKFFSDKGIGSYIGCGDGWSDVLNKYFTSLSLYVESHPYIQAEVGQVKEKFGQLRIYMDISGNLTEEDKDYLQSIHEIACNKADNTCEVCGEPGKLRNTSWLSTLCDKHYKQRKNQVT